MGTGTNIQRSEKEETTILLTHSSVTTIKKTNQLDIGRIWKTAEQRWMNSRQRTASIRRTLMHGMRCHWGRYHLQYRWVFFFLFLPLSLFVLHTPQTIGCDEYMSVSWRLETSNSGLLPWSGIHAMETLLGRKMKRDCMLVCRSRKRKKAQWRQPDDVRQTTIL